MVTFAGAAMKKLISERVDSSFLKLDSLSNQKMVADMGIVEVTRPLA
jgi:hypothetical protein